MVCVVQVPQTGVKPTPRSVEVRSPNYCNTREVPEVTFIMEKEKKKAAKYIYLSKNK